jgi:hypothetical protein
VVFALPRVVNTFNFPPPIARQIVILHSASDPAYWISAPRVWVFARNDQKTDAPLKRLGATYRKQEISHAYGTSLYFYLRASP